MMKKVLLYGLMLVMVLTLAGCGSKESASSDEASQKVEAAIEKDGTVDILIITDEGASDEFVDEVMDYLEKEVVPDCKWHFAAMGTNNDHIAGTMDYAIRTGYDMIVCASGEVEGAVRLYEGQYPDIEFIYYGL